MKKLLWSLAVLFLLSVPTYGDNTTLQVLEVSYGAERWELSEGNKIKWRREGKFLFNRPATEEELQRTVYKDLYKHLPKFSERTYRVLWATNQGNVLAWEMEEFEIGFE